MSSTFDRCVPRRLLALACGASLMLGALSDLGAQTWIRDLDNTSLDAISLALSSHGDVAAVYEAGSTTGVALFDAAGALTTTLTPYAGSGPNPSIADAAFLDDGSLLLVGALGELPWAARLSVPGGAPIWSRTLTRLPERGALEGVLINDLGHAVVHGHLLDAHFTPQAFLGALDPETGSVHYRRTWPGKAFSSLSLTANGELLLVQTDPGLTVTRTSAWGHALWRRQLGGGQALHQARAAETADGSIILLGLSAYTDAQYDFAAIKLAADGTPLLSRAHRSFPSTASGQIANVFAAVASHDGGLTAAVTQPMPGDGTRDAGLLKVGSDGSLEWLRVVGEQAHDEQALDLEITPDGGYVAVVSDDQGGVRVLRLDAAGDSASCPLQSLSTADQGALSIVSTSVSMLPSNVDSLWDPAPVFVLGEFPWVTQTCTDACSVTGSTYGAGTAGSGGFVPRLQASDGVCLGFTPTLEIDQVRGGAPGLLFVGLGQASLPGLGGTFLLNPVPLLMLSIQAGGTPGVAGAGALSLPLGSDLTTLQGLTVCVQAAFADPSGPTGKALSNGARFDVQ